MWYPDIVALSPLPSPVSLNKRPGRPLMVRGESVTVESMIISSEFTFHTRPYALYLEGGESWFQ